MYVQIIQRTSSPFTKGRSYLPSRWSLKPDFIKKPNVDSVAALVIRISRKWKFVPDGNGPTKILTTILRSVPFQRLLSHQKPTTNQTKSKRRQMNQTKSKPKWQNQQKPSPFRRSYEQLSRSTRATYPTQLSRHRNDSKQSGQST